MSVEDALAAGHAALETGRWDEARAAFGAVLGEHDAGEALLGMGEAVWWLGDPRRSVEYFQRAFVELRRNGDARGAAWAAMWLSLTYKSDLGNDAAASGWVARAERVLQGVDDGPLRGWLWLMQAYETSDLLLEQQLAERALEFARRAGDPDLELCALSDLGKALVTAGRIEEGLRLVDEAMASTLAGECSRLDTVVFTSCSMLVACELAADVERARQWCRVADDFVDQYGCPFLHAECRTLYGGLLVAAGDWAAADRELNAAVRMTRGTYPVMHALALTRLADLRLRQGRLEEADALLGGRGEDPTTLLVSAAVRLACGEPKTAVVLAVRGFDRVGQRQIEAAALLELLVEARLALGDVGGAADAVDRLQKLASQRSADLITARAALAGGRLSAARGDANDALPQLEGALRGFSRLDLPFETARARLELACCLVADNTPVAIIEARSALSTFERLGAARDADAAAALLRTLGVQGRAGPRNVGVLTEREREVLDLVSLGLSNPEIASRLVISRKTASHHVSNVLAKLGLRNRAEAAGYAARITRG
jgi:ATP/maltotriose-dependent transcriptional regulator MalT